MKRIIEISLNILFWILSGYVIFTALSPKQVEIEEVNGVRDVRYIYDQASVLSTLLGLSIKALLYYFNVYYLSRYLSRNKITQYFLFLLLAILIVIGLETLITVLIFGWDFYHLDSFMIQLWVYLFFVGISFVHIMILRWRKEEALKQQLREENLNSELKLLKSQINPHFLFNALNNLLSVSEKHQQTEVSQGIGQLSDMLRFILHDTSKEKITVEKEIEFIKNYIQLNELRFDKNDPIHISFNIIGNNKDIHIAPALFIPFIENAFKHGINIYNTSFIDIELDITSDKKITFSCANSNYNKAEVDGEIKEPSGVGLRNVRRRLNILYPDTHSLSIFDNEERFEINLKLDV